MLRALRFAITKEFVLSEEIKQFIRIESKLLETVSKERIREELARMFEYDTYSSFRLIDDFIGLSYVLFEKVGIKLVPKVTY